MIFYSKVDAFFRSIRLIVILIVGAAIFVPLFFEKNPDLQMIIILASIYFVIISVILWISFSIKYIFYPTYLFIRGGPFRSRIPYEDIIKVTSTTAIFTGYRVLSSRDSIEIFYRTAILGSVKVSPKYQAKFIAELQERCPNIQIKDEHN